MHGGGWLPGRRSGMAGRVLAVAATVIAPGCVTAAPDAPDGADGTGGAAGAASAETPADAATEAPPAPDGTAAAGCAPAPAGVVDERSVLLEMADLDHLATTTGTAYESHLASSHDRAAVSPAQPG